MGGAEDREEGPRGEAASPWQDAQPATFALGGAVVGASAICPREVWLMLHAVQPDEDHPDLEYGRFLHRRAYARERRDTVVASSRMDVLTDRAEDEELVVLEVKKSARARASARLQLGHYLLTLEERGVRARGELRFPEERRTEPLVLDEALRAEVRQARAQVAELAERATPPPAVRVRWCRRCAYAGFCWA